VSGSRSKRTKRRRDAAGLSLPPPPAAAFIARAVSGRRCPPAAAKASGARERADWCGEEGEKREIFTELAGAERWRRGDRQAAHSPRALAAGSGSGSAGSAPVVSRDFSFSSSLWPR
jgi:hypothetical protein